MSYYLSQCPFRQVNLSVPTLQTCLYFISNLLFFILLLFFSNPILAGKLSNPLDSPFGVRYFIHTPKKRKEQRRKQIKEKKKNVTSVKLDGKNWIGS